MAVEPIVSSTNAVVVVAVIGLGEQAVLVTTPPWRGAMKTTGSSSEAARLMPPPIAIGTTMGGVSSRSEPALGVASDV